MFFDNVSYFFQAPNKQIQENHAEFSHCFFRDEERVPRRPE